MFRVLFFVFGFLSCISVGRVGFADSPRGFTKSEIKTNTSLLDYHTSLILGKTNIALLGLAEIIKRQDLAEEEAHALFGKTVGYLSGVRAIIFIAADGALKFDSFSFPVPKVNLSGRSYFKKAKRVDETQLIIEKPVKGKTSKIPFLPIAKSVWKKDELLGVLTAVITPSALVANDAFNNCLHCVSLVTDLEGNIISSYPEGVDLSDAFKEKLRTKSKPMSGSQIISEGALRAHVHWIRNKEFPYISVFLEFIGR